MRTTTGCQALVESMVIGARVAGGLTPERAETLLTIMLEHPYFSGLDEVDLRDLLEQACQEPPATLAGRRPQLDDPALAFQLTAVVARSGGGCDQDILLDAATQLGVPRDEATRILDAGTPEELSILDAGPQPEEVYLDVLLAAAAADGRIADEELEHLVAFACSRLELRLLPRHEIEDVMAASLQGFLDHGFEAWMETLALSLPTDAQRRTAHQLAREMIAADHEITAEEEDFMRALSAALGLSS